MKIKVAIAEDQNLLADSIKQKLVLFKDKIDFRFRAANGKELLAILKSDTLIDIILMDIEMPVMDGIQATELISEKYPQIKIIILTVFDDDEKIFNAIQAGANGYLLKVETPQKLFEAITMAANGGAPMSPTIANKTLKLLRNPIKLQQTPDADFGLSKREIEVLEQISKGLDYKEISGNLFISPSTVRKHIENIYKKLQVNNKMKAVKKAIQNKII